MERAAASRRTHARVLPPFATDVALAARRVLLRAADALLPAPAVLLMHTFGIGRTQVCAAMAELGVADALGDGRLTAAELAPRVGADADALHRLLRMAAVDGLVRLDRRGRFRLTRLGSALRGDAPAGLRSWARYMGLESTRRAWGDLTESVRTGEAAFRRVNGTSVWEWFAAHPEEERLFAEAMRSLTGLDAAAVAAASLWPQHGVVCDVAGGTGTLLAAILAPRPGLRGVLVEGPGVLAEAEAMLASAGVRDRVELVEGDLLGRLDARGDVYVLKHVLHDWDDETSARILARVRATMPAGARLVVVEQLQERNRPHPLASVVDLQMMTQCENGRERSPDELRALLRGAGLAAGRLERTGANALFEGVAPRES